MELVAPWHVGSLGSGIEPVPPALTGGFFTTEPPGKSGEGLLESVPKSQERSNKVGSRLVSFPTY